MLVVTIRSTIVVGMPGMEPRPMQSRVRIVLDTPEMAIELASFTSEGNSQDALDEAMDWIHQSLCDRRLPRPYPVREEMLEIA